MLTIKSKDIKDPKNLGLKYLSIFKNTIPESLYSFKNISKLFAQLSDNNKLKTINESNIDEVDYVAIDFCEYICDFKITHSREDFLLSKHHALDFKDKKEVYIKLDEIKDFLEGSSNKIGRDLLSKIIADVKIKEARLSIGGRANKTNLRVWLLDLEKAEKFSKSHIEDETGDLIE